MIPILFEKDETRFLSNGIGRLTDLTQIKVTEERNGVFELAMEYPSSGQYFDAIKNDRIIYARHSDATDCQPFRIYKITKPLDGIISVFARHISYDLNKEVVMPFTASSCAAAISDIPEHVIGGSAFDFWTDKAVTGEYVLDVPTSARAVLGGSEGSILDRYGTGEYEWDHFTVKLYLHRGSDSGVTIRYGKNLTDLEHTEDVDDVIAGVAPFWKGAVDGEDTVVTLPEGAVVLETTQDYVAIKPLDLSSDFQAKPSEEQLRATATSYLSNQAVLAAKDSLKVSFIQLWQTKEYENVAPLQRLRLCDTATVIHPKYGISASLKVIKTVYDPVLERYDSMELGNARSTLAKTLSTQASVIASVQKKADLAPTQSFMESAITAATDLITGGLGGHVVMKLNADRQPEEILIMDTDDIATAVNVLRMNQNGIGFSNNGYEGPYRTAWTLDGRFVADFITAGTLNANIIRAGTLTGGDGTNFWNLETGEMNISGDSLNIVAGDKVSLYVQGTVNDVIDDIEVGTRNYLRGTPKSYAPAAYRFIEIPLTEALEEDVTYTFQAWDLILDSNSTGTVLYWGGGNNRIYPASGQMKPNAKGYLKCTFTITAAQARHAQAANLWLQLYNYPNGHEGSNATIGKWMLEKSSIASDWKPAPEDTETEIADFTEAVNQSIQDIQDQLDGVIDTWYYDYTPTTSNYPANEWTTEELKQDHEGDLFLNTDTGVSYRWLKENGVWYWKEIPDTAAATALQMAREAKDTADNKRRVFIRVPYVPYDEGDIWFQGESGDILTCTTSKTAQQTYDRTDWSKLSKYDTYIDFQTPFTWNASGTIATFTAKVYRSNADVTDEFDATSFKWYLRNEDNVEETLITIGKTCTVNASDLGYGSTVIGEFTTYERTYLTTAEGIYLTTADGSRLISLEEL